MDKIEVKDIEELKKKSLGKKIREVGKKVALGVMSVSFAISLIPTVEYEIAKLNAKNNEQVRNAIACEENKTEQIAQLFALAIESNPNIDEQDKETIISSFTEYVIEDFGEYFTEDTIVNMYAVASTERVKKMTEFKLEHGYSRGSYNPYFNTYQLYADVNETESDLLAHEQLHAILKSGVLGSGYANFIHGYGINEGLTSLLTTHSYNDEEILANMLGLIIGYDRLITCYLNSDLQSLKEEISKYITPQETDQLITLMDINAFSDHFKTFCKKNKISCNEKDLWEKYLDRWYKIGDLVQKMVENKYHCKASECNIGKLIFGAGSNSFDKDWTVDVPIHVVEYYDPEHVEISFDKVTDDYEKSYIFRMDEIEEIDIDVLRQQFINDMKQSQTEAKQEGDIVSNKTR